MESTGVQMHTLFIILACFAGVFAFAFFLAGMLALNATEPASNWREFLETISLSAQVRRVRQRWRTQSETRTLIYVGMVSLAALVLFTFLAFRTY